MTGRRTWILACTVAEAVGMTAAASAARVADQLSSASIPVRIGVVVLGGLVEGAALGTLQGAALPAGFGARSRRRWALATVVVAGLGWAAASAPSVAAGPDAGGAPPWPLVLAGAAALGAALGLVLGAAQAGAARVNGVGHWAGWSAVGWTAAMPVVFVGATGVGADWSWPALATAGAVTGLATGAVLGSLTSTAAARLAPRRPDATVPPAATPPPRPSARRAP